eukprot:882334-Rhodomonas_salina.1
MRLLAFAFAAYDITAPPSQPPQQHRLQLGQQAVSQHAINHGSTCAMNGSNIAMHGSAGTINSSSDTKNGSTGTEYRGSDTMKGGNGPAPACGDAPPMPTKLFWTVT